MTEEELRTYIQDAKEWLASQGEEATHEMIRGYLLQHGYDESVERIAAMEEAKQLAEENPSELTHTHMTLSAHAQALIHPTTGRLVIVQANKTVDLDATEAWELLSWLHDFHKDRLYQLSHQAEQAEEFTLYWHPSETYTARLAYGIDHPLWGSERLEVLHEGRWIPGKVGHVGAASGLVLWPREKEGNPEYITLTVGSRVRNVSAPVGDV